MTAAWFHGGVPGLAPGDMILCPDESGTQERLSAYAPDDAPHGNRTDVVYVTSRQDSARAFAAMYPDGALYRVEPEDHVGADPDAPTEAIMCRRARVVEVVRERIEFAHRTPESWMRLLIGGRS